MDFYFIKRILHETSSKKVVESGIENIVDILPDAIEENQDVFLNNKLHRAVELMHILLSCSGFLSTAGFRLLNIIEVSQTIQSDRLSSEEVAMPGNSSLLEGIERVNLIRANPVASLQDLAVCAVREQLAFDLSRRVQLLGALLPPALKRTLLREDLLRVPPLDGLERALNEPVDWRRAERVPALNDPAPSEGLAT